MVKSSSHEFDSRWVVQMQQKTLNKPMLLTSMTVIGKSETRCVATDDDRQFNVRRDESSRWLRLSNCQQRTQQNQSVIPYCTVQSPIYITCYYKFLAQIALPHPLVAWWAPSGAVVAFIGDSMLLYKTLDLFTYLITFLDIILLICY